jgi:hypothetical protein
MSDIRIQKTGEPDILQTSDGRLTLSVPIQIKRRSCRKLVTLPNGETAPVDRGTWRRHPSNWPWPGATAGWSCWNRGRRSH